MGNTPVDRFGYLCFRQIDDFAAFGVSFAGNIQRLSAVQNHFDSVADKAYRRQRDESADQTHEHVPESILRIVRIDTGSNHGNCNGNCNQSDDDSYNAAGHCPAIEFFLFHRIYLFTFRVIVVD